MSAFSEFGKGSPALQTRWLSLSFSAAASKKLSRNLVLWAFSCKFSAFLSLFLGFSRVLKVFSDEK